MSNINAYMQGIRDKVRGELEIFSRNTLSRQSSFDNGRVSVNSVESSVFNYNIHLNHSQLESPQHYLSDLLPNTPEKRTKIDGREEFQTENMEPETIEDVFEKYKKEGRDLSDQLIEIETKKSSQNYEYQQVTEDCKLLAEKKELQEKCIADLQQDIDNLRPSNQDLMEQISQDMNLKMRLLKEEFDTVFENDVYIKNTSLKMKEALKTDSKDLTHVYTDIIEEIENHKSTACQFIKKMREVYENYKCRYSNLNRESDIIDNELDETIKLAAREEEIRLNHKLIIDRKMSGLNSVENESAKTEMAIKKYKEESETVRNEVRDLETSLDEQKQTYEEEISLRRTEYEMIVKNLEAMEYELGAKEAHLQDVVDDQNQMLKKIQLAMEEKESLMNEVGKINELIEASQKSLIEVKENHETLQNKMKDLKSVSEHNETKSHEKEQHHLLINEIKLEINQAKIDLQFQITLEDERAEKVLEASRTKENLKAKLDAMEVEIVAANTTLDNVKFDYEKTCKDIDDQNIDMEQELNSKEELSSLLDKEIENIDEKISVAEVNILALGENDYQFEEVLRLYCDAKTRETALENLEEAACDAEDELICLKSQSILQIDDTLLEQTLEMLENKTKELIRTHAEEYKSLEKNFLDNIKAVEDEITDLKRSQPANFEEDGDSLKRRQEIVTNMTVEYKASKQVLYQTLGKLVDQISRGMTQIGELVYTYKYLKLSQTFDFKIINTISILEKKLKEPMKRMAALLGISTEGGKIPSCYLYEKLMNITLSMYGKQGDFFRPETPESEISSTMQLSPTDTARDHQK